jgi:phosphotransacetylase
VNPKLPSALEAAALCKMADRGQITGGVVDGPLAFDNAVSPEAARAKGIISPVAGQADILVVPDLEAGNMLVKQLDYLADVQSAGIVLGARLPIILTSRPDSPWRTPSPAQSPCCWRRVNRKRNHDPGASREVGDASPLLKQGGRMTFV